MHTISAKPYAPYLFGLILCFLFLTLGSLVQAAPKADTGALLSASDGKGELRFLWAPPADYWPAGGWQLRDQGGKTLADIRPLDPEHMKSLREQDRELIQAVIQGLSAATTPEEFANLRPLLGMQAMGSWSKALALGVAHNLTDAPKGRRTYSVVGLDASGKPSKTVLTSAPIDAHVATPALPAPTVLRAEPHPQGAALFWNAPLTPPEIPVMGYMVERSENGQPPVPAATEPVLLGIGWNSTDPAMIDELAQVGLTLTYSVRSLDAFGRTSPQTTVSLFMDDPEALLPPPSLTATAQPGNVLLAWKSSDNPNIIGHAVERSTSYNGLYTLLTLRALDPKITTWTDKDVVDSVIYYYRVRSVSPTGEMGPPSGVATAMPPTPKAPSAPQQVQAQTNPVQTELTWARADVPLAGYIVERRAEGSSQWSRLNPKVTPERRYVDPYTPGTAGVYHYRVIAVSLDNKQSPPSAEMKATIEDTTPPPTPDITSLDGRDGKVVLTFVPGIPESKTAAFSILRGRNDQRQGELLAQNQPASARSFEDQTVEPGQGYWYAVLAHDSAGRESELSKKRLVMVEAPTIPEAPIPSITRQTDPFTHVRAEFPAPPSPLRASLQRQDTPDGPWRTVVRDMTENWAVDANPLPDGQGHYRLVYHSPNGLEGNPSPPIALKR
jgi:fibronectin type 3 domain-containing protein